MMRLEAAVPVPATLQRVAKAAGELPVQAAYEELSCRITAC
jgi:hypothetical protein